MKLPSKQVLLPFLIGSIAFVILCQYIGKPFWGHHDWNNNLWTVTARNNILYGITCTKLGQSTTYLPVTSCDQLRFYMDHPPMVSWVVTVAYAVFGFSETVGRLPFAIISAGSAVLMFLIGKILFNQRIGIVASALMIITPMFQYFGKMINHEPLVLFSILWAVYAYSYWIIKQNESAYKWYLASAVFAGLSGWHGYFIFAVLAGVTWIHNRRYVLKSLIPGFILTGIFAAHILHTRWLIGSWNAGLFDVFLYRVDLSNVTHQSSIVASYGALFKKLFMLTRALYTNYLVVGGVGFIGFIGFVTLFKKTKIFLSQIMVLALGLNAGLIVLIFSQQAYIHDYLLIYFLPFWSLSAAVAFLKLTANMPQPVQYCLAGLLICVAFLERYQFTQTLLKTEVFRNYVELSQALNTQPAVKYLVEAREMVNTEPALLNYAYGKEVDIATDSALDFKHNQKGDEAKYQAIVVEQTPDTNELQEYLRTQYPYREYGSYSIYQTGN